MTMPLAELRAEVSVSELDSAGDRRRYLIAIEHRHFVVDLATASLVRALRRSRDPQAIAVELSQTLSTPIDAAQVTELVHHRLPRVLFEADDSPPKSPLSVQRELLSANALAPILALTRWAFRPLPSLILLALVLLGAAMAAPQLLTSPGPISATDSVLAVLLTLLGTVFHELGHLSACRAFGARHGGMGVGLYWIFPAFYADVTGAWRLTRRQRAAVDVGGLYFQSLYLLPYVLWLSYGSNPGIPFAVLHISLFMMLYTLNPVLKFDGYWLLSDLTGTLNLHERVRQSARRLLGRWLPDPEPNPPRFADTVLLLVFVLAALAFFTHLVVALAVSLQSALRHAGEVQSWQQRLPDWLMAALATLMLLMIGRRVLRATTSIART